MIKYTFKTMVVDQLLVIRVNCKKNSYLNNYLEKLFLRAYCFLSSVGQLFYIGKNIVRLLAWHIYFRKREALKKRRVKN